MICNSDDPAVGDEGEIEHWLGKASDSGHPAAMYLLSLKMKEDGRQHDSHRMLRRAAAKRYPMAGLDLAVD
jgi:TPR repeat protein